MTKQIDITVFQADIINALRDKQINHIEKSGADKQTVSKYRNDITANPHKSDYASADVCKSVKKMTVKVAQFLLDSEKQDFPTWLTSAPVKSIMRGANFLYGITENESSLGRDLIAQSLILTARTLNTDSLPLEILKHQTIKGHELEELSTMTKGKSIRKAERKMSMKTALSMISNRAGKHGYMQYLGMVTRADDKGVIINKANPFFIAADKLLTVTK